MIYVAVFGHINFKDGLMHFRLFNTNTANNHDNRNNLLIITTCFTIIMKYQYCPSIAIYYSGV